MTRLPALALAVVMAVGLMVAPVAADPEVLQPCTNAGSRNVVTLDGMTLDADAPGTPLWMDSTEQYFILDLAGLPVAKNSADVAIELSWDLIVEDYDLNLYDSAGTEVGHSENVNPIDGETETVSGSFTHCQKFSTEILAWTAVGASNLSLDVSASQFSW